MTYEICGDVWPNQDPELFCTLPRGHAVLLHSDPTWRGVGASWLPNRKYIAEDEDATIGVRTVKASAAPEPVVRLGFWHRIARAVWHETAWIKWGSRP